MKIVTHSHSHSLVLHSTFCLRTWAAAAFKEFFIGETRLSFWQMTRNNRSIRASHTDAIVEGNESIVTEATTEEAFAKPTAAT